MTADVEMLPLPSEVRLAIRAYARACVEANLAPLQAENERLRAEVERLRADRDSWEQQASDRVADWHAEHLRAERLAEALRDAHEALADAANTMYGIFGESQFCDSCTAFERANQWRQDWHGGDPLLQQITDALEQESNDA